MNLEITKRILAQNGHYIMPSKLEVFKPCLSRSQNFPLYSSKVSAGFPSPADDNLEKTLDLNTYLIKRPATTFFVRVNGDSMINAGINDGDVVVIKETNRAMNGDIVVALIENQEATLKRFFVRGDAIALEAANPAYETRTFSQEKIKVQGRLVGLLRTYWF